MTFGPVEVDDDDEDELLYSRKTDTDITATDVESSPTCPDAIAGARLDSLKKLQGNSMMVPDELNKSSPAKTDKSKVQDPRTRVGNGIPEAVIILKEERVRPANSWHWKSNVRHLEIARLLHSTTS
jgi:hypothetical protein